MLQELFSSGALNIVYAVIVTVSFLFALISLIGAELGDVFDFDLDADGDGFDFISISPFALAMFGSAFGLAGLITRLWFDLESVPSILWAVGSGIVIGGLSQVVFIYVLSPTKSSHFSLEQDAVGREAEVIVTIPGAGRGTIAYNNVSGRVTLGARSMSGRQIRSGQLVVIEKIVGRIALVQPAEKL